MRRSRFLIVSLGVCLALGLAVAPTAQAAPLPCVGAGCAGGDPQSSGCSASASNVPGTEHWGNSWSTSMRNSSACSARWGRIIVDDYLPTLGFAKSVAIESQRYYAGNWIAADWRSKRVGSGVEGTYWTPMIANLSDDRARVCHRFEAADGSWYDPWTCSGWVS